jgi:hypothetical protein
MNHTGPPDESSSRAAISKYPREGDIAGVQAPGDIN